MVKFSLLDLRLRSSSARSAIDSFKKRLALEEWLLRHDPKSRCWLILGSHDPPHPASCEVVLGLGGKVEKLVNAEVAESDGIPLLKRFSGGGTVALDRQSLLTTFIGRNEVMDSIVAPYPRELMEWSYDRFAPVFSCHLQAKRSPVPKFELRENDYSLDDLKIGGNAQSIVRGGWLHHTSFLWDYDERNMGYLKIPEKRPAYRGDRDHNAFITRLCDLYEGEGEEVFFDGVIAAIRSECELVEENLDEVVETVERNWEGGWEKWLAGGAKQSRTRHLHR